ncbi:hypothetical protein [Streptomyces showdoensis]|uniref:Uncharacterized protein n=1 Tax=Streptomyces showdoensis TaxID=68268 RepID=A0A2P2GJ61_STREW|nr:hypothetical protein [Streptomyces showdoensis]KKZ71556.1 hypothetical protein VO63_22945 [Streptomyces showdoensis]
MRRVLAAALAVGVLGGAAPRPGAPAAYRTAPDARPVRSGAELPGPGTYLDEIARGETHTYRLRLDGGSDVFLSAVLAPEPGSEVDVVDGLSLSLRTASGAPCGPPNDIRFYGDTARPVADYVSRRVEPGRPCQEPGEYVLVVEGVGRALGAVRRRTVEIGYVAESGGGGTGGTGAAPTGWRTEPPAGLGDGPSAGTARGGTGFNDAAPVGDGTWRDELLPGESRFYRVPVAWGQQLFVQARFANGTPPPGRSALPDGLRLALYNPARGAVDERKALYTGAPATLFLATAPAAYANRTQGATEAASAMRFEGAYYVQLALDRRAPGPVALALDLGHLPSEEGGGEREGGAGGREPDPVLRAVGIAGITTGTVLVAGLGAWPVVTRRRRRPRGRHAAAPRETRAPL